jgi:hypothetical protein
MRTSATESVRPSRTLARAGPADDHTKFKRSVGCVTVVPEAMFSTPDRSLGGSRVACARNGQWDQRPGK